MNAGIYQMDRSLYNTLPHYNQSLIKKWIELGDIPSEFAYWREHRHEEKETDSIRIGNALDCWKLERSTFEQRFFVIPEDAPAKPTKKQINAKKRSPATVESIAYWKDIAEQSAGKSILTCAEIDAVARMAHALEESESVQGLFENCKKAVLIANIFGFDGKGEMDLWSEKTEHIGDLKALKDVSPKGFADAFFAFGYDIQATFYLALAESLRLAKIIECDKRVFDFVCVKNAPPYTVKVHSFAPFDSAEHSAIAAHASARIDRALNDLDSRLKANNFADDQDWKLIEIPSWRLRRARMEMEAE